MRERSTVSPTVSSVSLLCLVLLAGFTWILPGESTACTALIAGKETTEDGSILFAKTEDDSLRTIDRLWFVDRQSHAPGSVVRLRLGGSIPQVAETYAYLWDEPPKTVYSSLIVNEWGVAFGSNACASREDSVEEVAARGDLVDGGLSFMLRFILAEQARTAREAVGLAARLLDEHGYNASGRNLNIVGPQEAWQLQMVRGKQYVARRVRDNEVALTANTYSIREVDCDDHDHFLCSPRLIAYAIERGWYDPQRDGDFDFARAYASDESHHASYNTRRHWYMARKLDSDFALSWQDADAGRMPASVIPDRSLTLDDVTTIMRGHFEGTDLDTSNGYEHSPHRGDTRAICVYTTHRTAVVQQRSWLPADIGTVIWRALGQPCSSAFVPWYLGAREVPQAYQQALESPATSDRDLLSFHFDPPGDLAALDRESASCVFGLLSGLVDADYQVLHAAVRKRFSELEAKAQRLVPEIDTAATNAFNRDPALARQLLAQHSGALAMESLAIAREMIDEIEWNLWSSGLGNRLHLPVRLGPEALARLTGKFRFGDGQSFQVVVRGAGLTLISSDGASYALTPFSETELLAREPGIELSYGLNDAGEPQRISVRRRGKDSIAERIVTGE